MDIPQKTINSFSLDMLAFGTWKIGGTKEKIEGHDDQKDIDGIRKAYELGIRRFDTAEVYAAGYAEELLGLALKGMPREELFITSKVFWTNLSYDAVLRAAEKSLEHLQTDYLDLYLIHAPSADVPIEETMKAMNELRANGKIKNIGVSNFNVDRLKTAQAVCDSQIVLNQVHYNLVFREPELKGVVRYCQDNDIFLEAWRPLQEGSLANKGITILDEMAKKYGKTVAQISLQWLLSQKNVITLFKSTDEEHIKENLGALDFEMSSEDVEYLSKNFPIQTDRSNSVQLN